ncbi:MAG: DUF87 domain-containing protein [Firmicutes bacterium]|nr:DUF87 domain-containing protein [Bacillota bacterium]
MRLIPKKSRINVTVWKNYTLFDILFMLSLISIAGLIAVSNLPNRLYWLFGWIFFSTFLLLPLDSDRVYNHILHVVRFLIHTKRFGEAAKRASAKSNVNLLVPITKIDADGTIHYPGYFGSVLLLDSVEFRLYTEFSQDSIIARLGSIFNAIAGEQSLQLVKIDRPINFDEIAKNVYSELTKAKGSEITDLAKIALLNARLEQIDRFNNLSKQYRPYYYLVVYDTSLKGLSNFLKFATLTLKDLGLGGEQLTQKETAVFLKYSYSRGFDEREFDVIEQSLDRETEMTESEREQKLSNLYINHIKPKSVSFGIHSYEVDGIYAFTYAISDYPLEVSNAWGASMFNIDNTKVVLDIKPVDRDKARKRLDNAILELTTREAGNKASSLIDQSTHIDSTINLALQLQNERENLFDCTLTLTGFNYNQEEIMPFRKKVRQEIMAGGFRVSMLPFRQFDGFINSSITRRNNLRAYERGINTLSLAAVFPFVFTSIIEDKGLTLGAGNYPVILDLFKRDGKKYKNSNLFVLGTSGSGKSFALKTLLSLLHSKNCSITILDPENEYKELARNFGGAWIDVGSAVEGRINPFHIYQMLTDAEDEYGEPIPAPPEVVFSSHLTFLEAFFNLVLPGITANAIEELQNFLILMYSNKGITHDTDVKDFLPSQFPIFDDLLDVVQAELALVVENDVLRKRDLQTIETHIKKFCGSGRFANLWNGASTLLSKERFKVLNFQSLFAGGNQIVANAQMLVVLRFLEQEIINTKEKNKLSDVPLHPIVILDEGHMFISDKYPVGLNFVYLWYKRIRKYGGLMAFITQNLADLLKSKESVTETTAIINNSQYAFILNLKPADIELLQDLYRNVGGINEEEAEEIANAATGQCFLISSPRERTSFQIVAPSVVEEMFTQIIPHGRMLEIAGLDNN